MTDMMKLIPLGNRILVKFSPEAAGMVEAEDGRVVTKAGIEVPADAIEERSEAEVIAIGYGCTEAFKEIVKPGNWVLIGRYSGERHKKVTLVYEAEIIGKMEPVEEKTIDLA